MKLLKSFATAIGVLAILFVCSSVYAAGWSTSIVSTGSVWKYVDDGSNLRTSWRGTNYNDSFWSNGPAQLGYGDGDEATAVLYGPDSGDKYRTTYFRHSFTATNVSSYPSLLLSLLRDDGAVVYLNGSEIRRDNMPTGWFNFLTYASRGVVGAEEDVLFDSVVYPHALLEGQNVLAVEIHQNTQNSSDISMELMLRGMNYPPPLASFTSASSINRLTLQASNTNMTGSAVSNFSGVCVSPSTDELFVIINQNEGIQVYDLDGNSLGRSINLPQFKDTEGMCLYDPDNNLFAISEENTNDITIVEITPVTSRINKIDDAIQVIPTDMTIDSQAGTEGITYDPIRDCFYAVKEKTPMRVYKIENGETTDLFDAEALFTNLCVDLADLYFDPYSQHLFVLSGQSERLFEVTLDGSILGWIDVAGSNPEGVTLANNASDLILIGEPNEYFRYEAQAQSGSSGPGAAITLPVELSWIPTNSVTLGYAITSATAVAGSHFSPASGTVTFDPGETSALLAFNTLTNSPIAQNQLLQIAFTNASGAYLGRDSVYEWIIITNQLALDVVSAHGIANPAVGRTYHNENVELNCSVTTPVDEGTMATQYVCMGWLGTGSVPGSGAASVTGPFDIQTGSSVTWRWQTNFWLGTPLDSGGTVIFGNQWLKEGTVQKIQAISYFGYTFSGWSGDTGGADTNNQIITVTLDRPRIVTAHFTIKLAGGQIPYPYVGFVEEPILDRFFLAETNILDAPGGNVSGCAIMPSTSEFIVIQNNPERIFAYDINGPASDPPQRTITLNQFDDTEGICLFDAANNLFAVPEESTNDLTIIQLTPPANSVDKSASVWYDMGSAWPMGGNRGIEGVTYDPANDCFYAVKEYSSMAVYKADTNAAPITEELFDAEAVFGGIAADLSDIFFDQNSRHLFILSHLAKKIFECDLSGNILASESVPADQPEGITMSADGKTLYVVGEYAEYFRYTLAPTASSGTEDDSLQLPLSLSWPWTNTVSVDFVITSATASAGGDYSPTGGTVIFPEGSTAETLAVSIPFDTGPEGDELLILTLTNGTDCAVGRDDVHEYTINANTTRMFTVASPLGSATPPVGTNYVEHGTLVLCTASGSPIEIGIMSTQYLCIGWTGTGSISPGGTLTNAPATAITEDSSIEWQWRTNYWLEAFSVGPGAATGGNGWRRSGSNAMVDAVSDPYYHFDYWTGDVASTGVTPAVLMMDKPKVLTAYFVQNLATNTTPEWWLAMHYPAGTNDFDAAALADSDSDRMPAWAEYRAATDPTNAQSVFKITTLENTAGRRLYWLSETGRTYSVFWSTNLMMPWSPIPLTSGVPGDVSGVTSAMDTNSAGTDVFYRIKVE